MTQFEKLGENIGYVEQILDYPSKVNKTNFASYMFGVFYSVNTIFLFSSLLFNIS